ncbi:MAG: hypothetical protein OHK0044_06340 [Burkholderiaceae bacterium]
MTDTLRPLTRLPALSTVRHPTAARLARPARVLVVFGKEWDRGAFAPQLAAGEIELAFEGFDLFRLPANARLLAFDAWRFVDRICAKYGGRADAVLSNNEQFGALLAAVIAQRLRLPGNDPRAVALAHHKLACREAQRRVAADAVPRFAPLGIALDDPRAHDARALQAAVAASDLGWPLFVKPIKATFSVLARRVDSAQELARHLRFGPFERRIIRRLVRPYAQITAQLAPGLVDPAGMLLETPMAGHQVNVDGYVFRGAVRIVGMADALTYPNEANGARHFLRFAYPSRIGADVRARIERLTRLLLAELGFAHGFFNVEFFVRADGRVQFIEVNPRLASQLADLYRWVDGHDIYRMLVALACGRDPATVERLAPVAGAAASFVWRKFDGTGTDRLPTRTDRDWLAQEHPGARLMLYPKRGAALAREYKWLGSHRYAVMNLSADDEAQLRARYEAICSRFGWPAPY